MHYMHNIMYILENIICSQNTVHLNLKYGLDSIAYVYTIRNCSLGLYYPI